MKDVDKALEKSMIREEGERNRNVFRAKLRRIYLSITKRYKNWYFQKKNEEGSAGCQTEEREKYIEKEVV